jgi:general stress protein 26
MERILERALSLQDEATFVTVSTLGKGGYPESRVMFNLRHLAWEDKGRKALFGPFSGLEGGFSTYIGTNTSSRKTAQARADGRACLYYSDNEAYRGLAVMGRLVEAAGAGLKEGLWREGWERYYPAGPGDPDFMVFAFKPETARYYEGLSVSEFDARNLPHA